MLSKTDRVKMREMLIECVPMRAGEGLRRWFERAARMLGESPRMIRSAYGNRLNENHRMKWKLEEAIRQQVRQATEAAGRRELAELKSRISAMEQRLLQIDPDFHSAQIDPLRASMRNAGGMDRTRD